jgi:hypothetical protein
MTRQEGSTLYADRRPPDRPIKYYSQWTPSAKEFMYLTGMYCRGGGLRGQDAPRLAGLAVPQEPARHPPPMAHGQNVPGAFVGENASAGFVVALGRFADHFWSQTPRNRPEQTPRKPEQTKAKSRF